MFDGNCKTEAIIYNVQWTPTGHNYIGKSQGNIAHRINRGHINGLVSFWNLRDKYDKYIAKESETIAKTPKGKTRRHSTVITPICSQELTQTPNQNGMSALVEFMNTRLTPDQNSCSDDETDDETTICPSQTDDETLDNDLSQMLTPKTTFQKVFGRPTDKKKTPNPTSVEELRDAFNDVDVTELTRFLWKRVEEHERVNGLFKNKGDMYSWIRENIKASIIHEQSATSRMKTAGKKICSLCLAERVNIFCAANSKESNKLMNKKSEITGACSCNARFLRLYLKGVGGAEEASCGCRKLACETCTTGLKSSTKKKRRGRPKKVP